MNIFIATIDNGIGTLTVEESWHCAKVLRKKAGDEIRLINGKGGFYLAELITVNEKKCQAKVIGELIKQQHRNYYLHLVIAPTKNIDRIEWMVEKAVEIGVDELSFVICKSSERKVIKTDRIIKIVESAVKQSEQARIPVVNEARDFNNIVKEIQAEQKLIAHCYTAVKSELIKLHFNNKKTVVVIGPEGDFTVDEVKLAESLGFTALSLGSNRLRTETAGLYVCQAVSILSSLNLK